jgi:hypothetical protein
LFTGGNIAAKFIMIQMTWAAINITHMQRGDYPDTLELQRKAILTHDWEKTLILDGLLGEIPFCR